ncbi:MAG TPA: glycerophosphodiester phosphodiesterase family protein [bacterium]|nr:glycerophosphodiester phosphodiesterase family protein [bacterium]HPN33097.1 glycerophosphodiester phosphodiesterase family protein [bacterium]
MKFFRIAGWLTTGTLMFCACTSKPTTAPFYVTAHRGASGWTPENTLAAFSKAIELGSDYSELDVRLSRDGVVVLSHDDSLRRTTGQPGAVWDYTVEELKTFDAGAWFGPEFTGEKIPTLQEVMRLVKGKMKLNIEVKITREEPQVAEKVIEVIRQEGFDKECMITSFDQATVEKVIELAPDLPAGLIFSETVKTDVFAGPWPILSVRYSAVNKEFVAKARKAGKQIHVWTVNDEQKMRELIALKVDGIITNYPDRLHKVLAESRSES